MIWWTVNIVETAKMDHAKSYINILYLIMGGTTVTTLPNFPTSTKTIWATLAKHQWNMASFAWFLTMPTCQKCKKKNTYQLVDVQPPIWSTILPTYVPSYLKCPANLEFLKTPSWWHARSLGDVAVPLINSCNCTEKSGTWNSSTRNNMRSCYEKVMTR